MDHLCKMCLNPFKKYNKVLLFGASSNIRQKSSTNFARINSYSGHSMVRSVITNRTCSKILHQNPHLTFRKNPLNLYFIPQRSLSALSSNILLNSRIQPNSQIIRHNSTDTKDVSLYVPTPVEWSYDGLEFLHDVQGLPWWLTIIAAAAIYRTAIIFPFAIFQQRVFARMEAVQPEINDAIEQMKHQLFMHAKENSWSKAHTEKEYTQQVFRIVKWHQSAAHCSPIKLTYAGFWQCIFGISGTMALGQMTGWYPKLFATDLEIDVLPALTTEGLLWFSDLTQSDLFLPMMLGLINLSIVELWSTRRGPFAATQDRFQNVLRAVAISTIPIGVMMPAAISLFWLTSSFFGLLQYLLLRINPVRRLFDIEEVPSESKRPFRDIKQSLTIRYFKPRMF